MNTAPTKPTDTSIPHDINIVEYCRDAEGNDISLEVGNFFIGKMGIVGYNWQNEYIGDGSLTDAGIHSLASIPFIFDVDENIQKTITDFTVLEFDNDHPSGVAENYNIIVTGPRVYLILQRELYGKLRQRASKLQPELLKMFM